MYNKANQYNSWISPKEKSGFRCMQIWCKRKNAQLTRSVNPGFGMCSQRAGAEIGAGPNPDMLANLQNPYGSALLAR